jgi:hypothetical protein
MSRHAEVEDTPPIVREDEGYIQDLEGTVKKSTATALLT